MAPPKEYRQKIVRTIDDLQFAVTTDEPWSITDASVGELIRTNELLSDAIARTAHQIQDGLEGRGIRRASLRFGVSLSPGGGFYITEGQSDAHIVVDIELGRGM